MPEPAAETKFLARKICAGSFFRPEKRMAWWLQYWMKMNQHGKFLEKMPPNQTIQIDLRPKGTLKVLFFFMLESLTFFDRLMGVMDPGYLEFHWF